MSHLERLNRYSKDHLIDSNDIEVKKQFEAIKEEMESNWISFKRALRIRHGLELQDNRFDELLLYLIRKGIL